MTTVKLIAALGSLPLSWALVACGGAESGGPEDTTVAATSAAQSEAENAELTLDEVESMLSALEDQTGAPRSDIQVGLLLYGPSGGLSADALDPAKPTEYNQYTVNIYTDRSDVRPYDYGGAEKYEALQATLFPADSVTPETVINAWQDSFNRVEGDPAEFKASGPTITRNSSGELQMSIVNGPERDRQTVTYDPSGQFISVS